MLLRIAAIAALMILVAPLASARPLHFSPKTDSRGFIDVWQLRRDVARAESYYYAPPEDRCEPGGPDDTEAKDRAYDRCMKRRDRWAADNAQAESFMKTLKVEEVYLAGYGTFDDVARRLPRFIEDVYNAKRMHS